MMKSNKQRRAEIKAARLKKAERKNRKYDPTKYPIPDHAILADQTKLVCVGTAALVDLPFYYLDKPFLCKSCGAKELWTAKQQKWWDEIAQGAVETTAVRCRSCRKRKRAEKAEQQAHMQKMSDNKPHPNEEFFNKKY